MPECVERRISCVAIDIFTKIDYKQGLESALNRCSVQPLRRARIPDAVFVQLFLLRMGMSRPETCRG